MLSVCQSKGTVFVNTSNRNVGKTPQGSIVGPLLFIVFINDLPFHVTSSTIDLYTDDKTLLYIPTQIRFLIGGERVTCLWSKLNDALGRAKLNDALGKQHLELSTRT